MKFRPICSGKQCAGRKENCAALLVHDPFHQAPAFY